MTSNRLSRVAMIGAGGNSGRYMTEALLKTGRFDITALTRVGSESKLPQGVRTVKVDYEKPETLVEGLRGQDALVVTLGGLAAPETQEKIVRAAAEAQVPWVLPNEWSPDTANDALVKDVFPFAPKGKIRNLIQELGKSSYIAVSTGFWYEWSLAIAPAYGMDFANRAVTFYDDGNTKISTSTWPQVGRAVAALLSLPVKPEGSNKEACLEALTNRMVYMQSFKVSQKEMFASALRVTVTKEDDWKISYEPSMERYSNGLKEIKEGKRVGFAKMMYTRVFYQDGSGDLERKGTINALLDLPEEDLDEATARAAERSKNPGWG